MKKFSSDRWVPYTIATCSAVILYFLISNIGAFFEFLGVIGGFVFPVFLGLVFAYCLNPLVVLVEKKVFFKVKGEILRRNLSVILSVAGIFAFLGVLLGNMIPQLANSAMTFVSNMGDYIVSLQSYLKELSENASGMNIDISSFVNSSDSMLDQLEKLVPEDASGVINTSKDIGSGVVNIILGIILSIYFLIDAKRLKMGFKRLMKALLTDKAYRSSAEFWHKCDQILVRYIAFSLIDALIVGIVNAIFMAICGMKYAVLVSMIVGVTNLAPTFGPLVGAILGAFILLLVKPWYALAFLIFTVILQTFDGYILKPKLFGESFGVSGLWILIGIIVGGRMFGVVGILFAIPAVAILDFTYKNYFLYKIEELKEKRYGASAAPKEERNGTDADSEEDRNTNSEAVLRTEKERSEDRNLK